MDVKGPVNVVIPEANAQTQEPVQNVISMTKGDGERSYSKNSGFQAFLAKAPMLVLNEGLERVRLPSIGGPVVVADLGCSSGPNSISQLTLIVDKLRHRLPEGPEAEFQAYCIDLPSNDFNNLFQLLNHDKREKKFYAAGVAGSYFDRLFPKSFVHVFYSFNSLHWLSKLPDAVLDKNSPAYNRGNSYIHHSNAAVAAAYQQQAALDLKNFLQARAAELVPGGLLFFSTFGRLKSDPAEDPGPFSAESTSHFDKVLGDLVAEGLLSEELRDTFNHPLYRRSREELQEAIASCGPVFDVAVATVQSADIRLAELYGSTEPSVLAKKMIETYRAVMDNFFVRHFGKPMVELIWNRYEESLANVVRAGLPDFTFANSMILVSLIRK